MILRYIFYLLLLLVVFTIGVVRYKKLTPPFKILTFLIGATFLLEGIKKIIGIKFHNSMPVEHLTALIEFISFSFIYYFLLDSIAIKKTIVFLMAIFIVAWLFNLLFFETLTTFPSTILNASQFIYLIYSLFLFKQMLLFPSETSLVKQSVFWFNIGILLFSSSIFLGFGLTNFFRRHNYNPTVLYAFDYFSNLLFYILIGISLFYDNYKAKL